MSSKPSGGLSIGVIMDGNRRWAKARGMPGMEGHRAGWGALRAFMSALPERGITCAYFYTFSQENWNRAPVELAFLFQTIEDALRTELAEIHAQGVRVRFIGEHERLPATLREIMAEAERTTAGNTRLTTVFAVGYGGHQEILRAAARVAVDGITAPTVDEFAARLDTAGLPDPDLIIRTGGEQRLSNFLSWQSTYSELFFIPEYWPDMTPAILDRVLAEYRVRDRRFGK